MGSEVTIRTRAAERRRFALAVVGFAVVFTALGRLWGEDLANLLQETPTTRPGWLFVGWLVGGPPLLVTLVVWNERGRLWAKQLRDRTYLLAAWLGASMVLLPARLFGVDDQFGTGALVGEPLSTGWVWGALANLIAVVFVVAVLLVLRSVSWPPTPAQRDLTARFVERAWLVLLVTSLGFALYGGGSGLVNGGT